MFDFSALYKPVQSAFSKVKKRFAAERNPRRMPTSFSSKISSRICIHIAALQGDYNRVKQLIIEDGLYINSKYKHSFGNRPIHAAAEGGHPEIIELFLKVGVSANVVNDQGETPLHIAALNNNYKAVECLLAHRANPHRVCNCSRTALHMAAMSGSADALAVLIKAGAKLNGKDRYGWSPMYLAATAGSVECIKLLLENKAICKLKTKTKSYTPVHRAAESDQLNVIEFFLESGVPVDFATIKGYTLLHAACRYGNIKIVEYLLKNGADINQKTIPEGAMPLYFALKNCNPDTAELLIQNGAHLEYHDSKYGLIAVIQYLCRTRPRGYFESSKVIIKYLLLFNQNLDEDIELMKELFWQPFFPYLVQYYKDCQKEMIGLKETHYCRQFKIWLHQFLYDSFDTCKMVRYLQHQDSEIQLRAIFNYMESYPIYDSIKPVIQFNINKGKEIISLLADADAGVEYLVPSLPFECRRNILDYLNAKDLKNLQALYVMIKPVYCDCCDMKSDKKSLC